MAMIGHPREEELSNFYFLCLEYPVFAVQFTHSLNNYTDITTNFYVPLCQFGRSGQFIAHILSLSFFFTFPSHTYTGLASASSLPLFHCSTPFIASSFSSISSPSSYPPRPASANSSSPLSSSSPYVSTPNQPRKPSKEATHSFSALPTADGVISYSKLRGILRKPHPHLKADDIVQLLEHMAADAVLASKDPSIEFRALPSWAIVEILINALRSGSSSLVQRVFDVLKTPLADDSPATAAAILRVYKTFFSEFMTAEMQGKDLEVTHLKNSESEDADFGQPPAPAERRRSRIEGGSKALAEAERRRNEMRKALLPLMVTLIHGLLDKDLTRSMTKEEANDALGRILSGVCMLASNVDESHDMFTCEAAVSYYQQAVMTDGHQVSSRTSALVMQCAAASGHIHCATRIFLSFSPADFEAELFFSRYFLSAISAGKHEKKKKFLKQVFDHAEPHSFLWDNMSLISFMQASSAIRDYDMFERVLALRERWIQEQFNGKAPYLNDGTFYLYWSALIMTARNQGLLQKSIDLYKAMREERPKLPLDPMSFNAAITSAFSLGDEDAITQLFADLENIGVRDNANIEFPIIFANVLRSKMDQADFESLLQTYDMLVSSGTPLALAGYRYAIHAALRLGYISKTKEIAWAMLQQQDRAALHLDRYSYKDVSSWLDHFQKTVLYHNTRFESQPLHFKKSVLRIIFKSFIELWPELLNSTVVKEVMADGPAAEPRK